MILIRAPVVNILVENFIRARGDFSKGLDMEKNHAPTTEKPPPGSVKSFEDRLHALGSDLASDIGSVLGALPGAPLRPMDVARQLGINKDAASRIVKATRQTDPVAVAYHLPGPDPLGRLIDAAAKCDLDPSLLDRARRTVDRFRRFIAEEAGDRGALEAIISAWLPEARERQALNARQTAFRGMALIKGLLAEMTVTTALLAPSPDQPGKVDLAWAMSVLGLRRTSRSACMRLGCWAIDAPSSLERLCLDGRPARHVSDLRLDRFCSRPMVNYESERVGDAEIYTLRPPDLGVPGAVDTVFGELNRAAMWEAAPPEAKGSGKAFISHEVTVPSRVSVLDVLVAPGLWKSDEPSMAGLDLVPHGLGDINDPHRLADRIESPSPVMPCGRGASGLRLAEAPDYADLLRAVGGALDQNIDDFRAYRCRVEYPVYGTQLCMTFRRERQIM